MSLAFPLIMAWRDSRGARRRLALYLGAVSLGVAALVAINSFGADMRDAVHAQARTLLGADLELRARAPFPTPVEAALDSLRGAGIPIARVTSFASMVLAPRTGLTRLFEIRAISGAYPYYGTVHTDPPDQWATFTTGRAVLVDPAVLVYLDARVGDSLDIGESRFVVAGVVTDVPGDVGIRTAIGPRVFLPARFLTATRLLGFGSRAVYRAYVSWPDGAAVQRFLNQHNAAFERYRIGSGTVADQEEDVTRALGRLARYLGLVGLIALLLGGVGVGSAVTVFVREKLDSAAVLRCLGASQRAVLAVYLLQAAALGLVGAVAGAALGIGVQALLPGVVRAFLPLDVPVSVRPSVILGGVSLGLGTALLFALLPLLALRGVPPLRALRRDYDAARPPARRARLGVYAALLAALVGVSLWQAPGPRTGLAFAAAVLVTTAVLGLTARGLMWATRRFFPHGAPYPLRQGVANLFRPQNQTVAVILAMGFGVFLIATLYVVQRNLLDQFALDARPDQPNLVLFDVQADQQAGVRGLLTRRGITPLDVTPIVPARIARVNGHVPDSLPPDASGRRRDGWALRREYRLTYRDRLNGSEEVTAGAWWTTPRPPHEPARISLEEDFAAQSGLHLGDRITWDVQGVPIETRVTSLRHVRWARFEPNFFVVFEPGVLEHAPQTFVMLARSLDPTERATVQRDVVLAYPNVSALDLTLVQRTLEGVFDKVTLAIRFMALFSIGSGVVILVGALTASRVQRVREAVLLKTLGATAAQVRRILVTEYLAWGSLSALTGVALAGAAGWALVTRLFDLPYALPVWPLAGAWAAVCLLTVVVGFANSRAVLHGTPLQIWRELSE